MASQSAPVAPIIEPPRGFGHVAPGIYRCSASSLIKGLSPAPKGWRPAVREIPVPPPAREGGRAYQPASTAPAMEATGSRATSTASGGGPAYDGEGTTARPSNSNGNAATVTANLTPTEAFLASLRLRMVLLLAPERMPTPLAAWCALHNIQLVHLGLGALVDSQGNGRPLEDSTYPPSHMGQGARWATSVDDMISLERLAKDALELLLRKANLPCLICDMSGVKETGIVVGCLRRVQRFNFASIRLEYRSYAGNRSRSAHERFIEMFDTDLIDLPTEEELPTWLADQMVHDQEEEEKLWEVQRQRQKELQAGHRQGTALKVEPH